MSAPPKEIVIAFAGQSLGLNLFTFGGAGNPQPNARTFMWNQGSRTWTRPTGVGAIEYANMINNQSGYDVYLINACSGGSALVPTSVDPTNTHNHWMSLASDSPLMWLMNQVASCGKTPDRVEWIHGPQDHIKPSSFGDYLNCLMQLSDYWRSTWNKNVNNMPVVIWPTAKTDYGHSEYVLAAQTYLATYVAGFQFGPAFYDLNFFDRVHVDDWGCREMGDRGARNVLKDLKVKGFEHCGPGPRIAAVYRNQHVISVDCELNGAASLQATNPVSGFTVWDSQWNVVPIVRAEVATYTNNRIDIILAYPAGPVHVGYQNHNRCDSSSVVRDSSDTFIPGRGQLLQPCVQWFNTSN